VWSRGPGDVRGIARKSIAGRLGAIGLLLWWLGSCSNWHAMARNLKAVVRSMVAPTQSACRDRQKTKAGVCLLTGDDESVAAAPTRLMA